VTTQALDKAKVDAFASRMIGYLNGGSVALMTSIGYHTGLIDALADMQPSTSAQIAERAGLNERYVREWLGTMVSGRVVDYNPTNRTYWLPPEHAAVITRAAGPQNLAVFAASSRSWRRSRTASSGRSSRAGACHTPTSLSSSA